PTPLKFQLMVNNGNSNSNPSTVTLTVNPHYLPVAVAGSSSKTVYSGDPVTLDGSKSYDPCGIPLKYSWTQTGGPHVDIKKPSTSPQTTFTAPAVPAVYSPTSLKFQLVVNNGNSNSVPSSTISINVKCIPGDEELCPYPTCLPNEHYDATSRSCIPNIVSNAGIECDSTISTCPPHSDGRTTPTTVDLCDSTISTCPPHSDGRTIPIPNTETDKQ